MDDYDPYDDADLTDEEMIQAAMGASIPMELPDGNYELEMNTNNFSLTKVQAGILCDALRSYHGETRVQQETARRTQDLLKQKFDIE